jgi:hypothetical protein
MSKKLSEMTKTELANQAIAWEVSDKGTKDELLTRLTDEKLARSSKSNTLKRYRPTYVKVMAYSGKASLSNGDAVAKFLEGADPLWVMTKTEQLLGLGEGFLVELYKERNPGAKRMNSGNRLRAALKRGDLTQEQLV